MPPMPSSSAADPFTVAYLQDNPGKWVPIQERHARYFAAFARNHPLEVTVRIDEGGCVYMRWNEDAA